MNLRGGRRPAILLISGALMLCLFMTGCEDWFASETATAQPPDTVTVVPTEEHEATATEALPTQEEPSTPAPSGEDGYPYPVDLPEEPANPPQYPEAYPGD